MGLSKSTTDQAEGYHMWHCETFGRVSRDRVLAYMAYLNDVDEGGETEFLHQHTRFKPVKGDFLIWQDILLIYSSW